MALEPLVQEVDELADRLALVGNTR